MAPILVSGLINLEVTLRVEGFPFEYAPVRYPFGGVRSSVAGVGYNLAAALHTLGDPVRLLSLVGQDAAGGLALQALHQRGIDPQWVRAELAETAHAVILYDPSGRRAINTDLKDIQERRYPLDIFEQAAAGCSAAVLANINFSRSLLAPARRRGLLVATDVHAITHLDDDYNRDFMAAAQILFLSDERLDRSPEDWARQAMDRYGSEIVVVGLGAQGALLAVRRDSFLERIPAVAPRPVVNTIGAGDALFACFLHYYLKSGDPYLAIRRAVWFAGYKIGDPGGAAAGFLSEGDLEQAAG